MDTYYGTAHSSTSFVRAIHTAVAGRSRYHVVGLHRSKTLKHYLEQHLSAEAGIRDVSANLWTGNILVHFNPAISSDTIAHQLEQLVLQYRQGSPASIAESPQSRTLTHDHPRPQRRSTLSTFPSSSVPPFICMDQDLQVQPVQSWHLIEAKDVLHRLQTSATSGLTHSLAQENLRKYGANSLPESASRSRLSLLVEQFKSLPVALLSVAAGLSIATGGVADAAVIMGVVFINAAIGYTTETQSERIIHSLKHLVQPVALVIREGILTQVDAQAVALGDILVLKPGSYVAADARLIEANDLSVDESALTGESLPVTKTVNLLVGEDLPVGDRTNMVYMGTLITGGQGLAVVVAVGAWTEMGQIQTLVGTATLPTTPMERQLDQAGGQLVFLSSAVCGVVFALGMLRGYGFLPMLKSSIALAVAAVPEGLPAVATTTLALGIQKMRQHKVLIRRLDAVETLGSVQSICLDKTGTLTINKMSVVELYANGDRIHVTAGEWQNGEESIDPQTSKTLLQVLQVLVLCNESETDSDSSGDVTLNGTSTENALLELAIAAGMDVTQIRQTYPQLAIHHRSEHHNVMVTIHTAPEEIAADVPAAKNTKTKNTKTKKIKTKNTKTKKIRTSCSKQKFHSKKCQAASGSQPIESRSATPSRQFVAVKGSPAEVLALCNWIIQAGEVTALTQSDRKAIEIENDRMAGQALRVLGVAYRYANNLDAQNHIQNQIQNQIQNHTQDNLIWLGLVGMADPIRPGTTELMQVFHRAGIETIMITGDQSPTAYAIGKALNLNQGEPLQILDSTALTHLEPEAMQALCQQVHVFARISPAHKLQIVQSLQQTGKVVAMTGDGINDAPALKAADVGVAMGHVGTDVAREVADVVLEDDDLQTMTIAISQGRTIYHNIRKSVHFLLSTNLSEILVMLTATSLGLGQPLNAMQLLWLNLVTDIFPGLALALDPPDPEVLNQPPRDPHESIIQPADFRRILWESTALSASALAAYGYAIGRYGLSPRASTIAFMSLTCAQLFHSLSCRSTTRRWGGHALPPNRYLSIALTGSLGLQLLSAIVPGLRTLLHITSISVLDSAIISASALLPLLVNEATKRTDSPKLLQPSVNPEV
ncbi:cation-translocating P-type ATPase [Egbenema bharatensis]|uniref:cation-translocating P-type ATPase n=1 Tax=Egbenema bharatensis TaxID=3463334 RepID=UPI003A8818DE